MSKRTEELKQSGWLFLGLVTCFWLLVVIEDSAHKSTGLELLYGLLAFLILGLFVAAPVFLVRGLYHYFTMQPETEDPEMNTNESGQRSKHVTKGIWALSAVACGLVALMSGSDDVVNALAQGAVVGAVMGGIAFLISHLIILARRARQKAIEHEVIGQAKKGANAVTKKSAEVAEAVYRKISKRSPSTQQKVSGAKYDNLLKLKTLLDSGVLSQEEFEKEKARIMAE